MIRKHLENLITESLKYFFNIDHSICHHWMITTVLLFSIARIFFKNIVELLHDGILTVQYDLHIVKTKIAAFREQLENDKRFGAFVKKANDVLDGLKPALNFLSPQKLA